MDLIKAWNSVCSSNGDDVAFYVTPIPPSNGNNTNTNNNNDTNTNDDVVQTVGFSELNENINSIANELCYRHNIRPTKNTYPSHSTSSSSSSSSTCTNNCTCTSINHKQSILIVSSQPSPGEAAAVLACTLLQSPFVPLSTHGPHRISQSRIQTIINDTNPSAAIVVLSIDYNQEEEDYWDENRPALSHAYDDIILHLDSTHETIQILNQFGISRIVIVNAKDGSVIGPLSGGSIGSYSHSNHCSNSDLSSSSSSYNKHNDISYILYTSGSTTSGNSNNNNKPKAVN